LSGVEFWILERRQPNKSGNEAGRQFGSGHVNLIGENHAN
jgi:hypothetical protein